jgi:protein transport protein SEC61 subunit beta
MISHFSFCFLLSFSPRASRLHPIETRFFPILRRGVPYAHTSSSFSYTQIKSLGLRKRPGTGSGSNIAAKGGAANSSILKFYTDDSPGLKITPVVVLVMSVCFIGFVTILHAMSKIYQYKMS